MSGRDLQRIRITYSKQRSLRFIGHLDMLRTWERTLRRANLPIAFTQGFHPHARINLGAALPLGFTSDWELVEIWIEDGLTLGELEERLKKTIPPGVAIQKIENVDLSAPKLQKRIISAEYEVTLNPSTPNNELGDRVVKLLAQESLPRTRRGKSYDLRPLIEDLSLESISNEITLRMRLMVGEGKTGRPDEVVLALGEDPLEARIHRSRLVFKEPSVREE